MQLKGAALFSVVASGIVPYMIYARAQSVDIAFALEVMMLRLDELTFYFFLAIPAAIGATAAGGLAAAQDQQVPRMTLTWMLACALVFSALVGSNAPLGLLEDWTDLALVGRAMGRDVVVIFVLNLAFFAGALGWAWLAAWTVRHEERRERGRSGL